jgi:putative serine/threonine protein kinase
MTNENNLIFLAKGKRSIVYLKEKGKKKIAVKTQRQDIFSKNSINHEVDILKLVNKHKIGPKLIGYKNNEFSMEFIEGTRIDEFFQNEKDKKLIKKIVLNILEQCRTLDKLKLNKKEMANPYKHVIIKKNKPIMIDFERAHFTEKPQNTTQFFQYLARNKVVKINDEVKHALKQYKINQTEENYKRLICLFG